MLSTVNHLRLKEGVFNMLEIPAGVTLVVRADPKVFV